MLDVTPQRVSQIVQEEGGPPRNEDGSYPSREFAVWMVEREIEKRGLGEALDQNKERARLLKAQADKVELEVAELKGTRIPIDVMVADYSNKFVVMRGRLLTFPALLAPRFAAKGKEADAELCIRDRVYELLHELAADGLSDSLRARLAQHREDDPAPAKSDGEPVGGSVPDPKPRKQRRARKVADD
jgi:hypothetical protein